MKWIIVNLYNCPSHSSGGIIEERRTIDVDDIHYVKQVRRRNKRDGEVVSDNVTIIGMKSESWIECSDSFKDVITAIELARNTENRRRKAGEAFFCSVIDVQELVAGGAKETFSSEVKDEERETLRFPRIGDIIVGEDVSGELVIKYYHPDYIEVQAVGDSARSGFVYANQWHKYKIVRKGS